MNKSRDSNALFRMQYFDHYNISDDEYPMIKEPNKLANQILENRKEYSNSGLYERYGKHLTNYVRPFFDLDKKGSYTCQERQRCLDQAIDFILKMFNLTDANSEIAISEASVPDKISFHFVVPVWKVKYTDLMDWTAKNKKILKSLYLDDGIYGERRTLRIVGTSKAGKNAPLKPLTLTDDFTKHFLTFAPNETPKFEFPKIHEQSSVKDLDIKKTKINLKTPISNNSEHSKINLEEISQLVKLLTKERADDRKTWIEVGLCLHNMDYCQQLLDSWIDFSRLSEKYKEGECEREWKKFRSKEDGLGVGSLHRWAKYDNLEEYQIFRKSISTPLILKCQSLTHADCAHALHSMFRYNFKFVAGKSPTWYHFCGHRWHESANGIDLKKKIGTEFLAEVTRSITYYFFQANQEIDEEIKSQYIIKSKGLSDLTYKLRDSTFKDKIIKESELLFHEQKFGNKIDANRDLFGFDNGIYNLKTGEFRDGQPDDYVSKTCGYDYEIIDDDDERIVEIFIFLNQVFTNKDTRDYVLILLSSFLDGYNPREKFHIWTGVGGNGKSKLIDLTKITFGKDYTSNPNIGIISGKDETGEACSPVLSSLKGKRLIIILEPASGLVINWGKVKRYTGGDDIDARALYKDPLEYKPQFKIVYCGQHKPELPLEDEGTQRRVEILQFNSKFVDEPNPKNSNEFLRDYHLSEKFDTWKAVFMYILLQHYKIYQKKGIVKPHEVIEATDQYKQSADIVQDFINEHIEQTNNSKDQLTLTQAWQQFDKYQKNTIIDKSQKLLKKQFDPIFIKKINAPYITKSRYTIWRGFTLAKSSPDIEEEIFTKTSSTIDELLANTK